MRRDVLFFIASLAFLSLVLLLSRNIASQKEMHNTLLYLDEEIRRLKQIHKSADIIELKDKRWKIPTMTNRYWNDEDRIQVRTGENQ